MDLVGAGGGGGEDWAGGGVRGAGDDGVAGHAVPACGDSVRDTSRGHRRDVLPLAAATKARFSRAA